MNQPIYPYAPVSPSPVTPAAVAQKPVFHTADIVFAWLCFLFAYLFCRTLPVQENALGGFLFILTLYAATFVLLKIKKVKVPRLTTASAVCAVVIAAAPIVSENGFLSFLAYTYAFVTYCYFVYAAQGNAIEPGLSDLVPVDYCKALFVLPFHSFADIFIALSQGKGKAGAKVLLKVLLGVALSVVPTVIVLLLLSYDAGFSSILEKLFDFDLLDVFSHIGSMLVALPLGMYLFGLYSSASKKVLQQTVTADGCRNGFAKIRVLPQITMLASVCPILFLYVIYFISQWQYYMSGFTGKLPANFSYAEYAREGFFQLCAVSVINLLILVVLILFMQRGKKNHSPVLRILTVVFCVFTLVLISTAVAKLVMYIQCYGLTQKRIYAMWLMVVIAIVYILIAVGRFVSRLRSVAASAAVCVVLFAALSLCNVNMLTAEYNVSRYIAGTLEQIDLEAMEELDNAAVPALVRLAEELEDREEAGEPVDELLKQELYTLLNSKAYNMKNDSPGLFSFTIPYHQAKSALMDYGLLEK